MIIDAISDLHGFYPELEGGDLLIIAGDLTTRDRPIEYQTFKAWLLGQNYKRKIVIAGNHDNYIQRGACETMWMMPGLQYLCDSGTEFEGLKIWGSPWTKIFPGMNPHCKAFTFDTEEELAEKWARIPYDIDILITHSPALKILDANIAGKHCGSRSLKERLFQIKPRVHVFGHIHEKGYKFVEIKFPFEEPKIDQIGDDILRVEINGGKITRCINCSHVNENYQPVNKPIRVIL
jgi:Icc-related predicted phosphoesterase